MLKLMGKKIFTILCSNNLFILTCVYLMLNHVSFYLLICIYFRVLEINGRQLTSPVRDITPLLKSKTAYVQLCVVSQQSSDE